MEHWLDRFERSASHVATMYGDWFQRAWLLYLAGSIAGFRTSTLQLFQVAFAGPQCRAIPWTRECVYQNKPCVPAMS
jgi:cyclopropane-fatty-acyl-phospholipid synthase